MHINLLVSQSAAAARTNERVPRRRRRRRHLRSRLDHPATASSGKYVLLLLVVLNMRVPAGFEREV